MLSISDNSELRSKESAWKSELHVMYLVILPTILSNYTEPHPILSLSDT